MGQYIDLATLKGYGLSLSGRSGYVLIEPVIAHVLRLEELGWTYERTSKTAGLAACSVRQMLRQGNTRIMARRAIAILDLPLVPFLWKNQRHGTDNAYREQGCRCDSCRKAHSDYQKVRRYRVGVKTRMVPAEPVRRWIQEAIDRGLTNKGNLHRAIGGSSRTITELMAGRYSMMRQPTVTRIAAYLADCYDPHPLTIPIAPKPKPTPRVQKGRKELPTRMTGGLTCKMCDRPLADHSLTEFCIRIRR